MAARKRSVQAPTLSAEVLARLAGDLQPAHKTDSPVYRGNERSPIIAIGAPAYGKLSTHTVTLTRACCTRRSLGTATPGAFRIQKNDAMPDLIVMEPVVKYDEHQTDLYELKWFKGNSTAGINLLPLLQPRNQETPRGYVNEAPVSLVQLPGDNHWVLILHMDAAELRAVESADLAEDVAAGELTAN